MEKCWIQDKCLWQHLSLYQSSVHAFRKITFVVEKVHQTFIMEQTKDNLQRLIFKSPAIIQFIDLVVWCSFCSIWVVFKFTDGQVVRVDVLMTWNYCHDQEVMSSNPIRTELGVRSTSVLNCAERHWYNCVIRVHLSSTAVDFFTQM